MFGHKFYLLSLAFLLCMTCTKVRAQLPEDFYDQKLDVDFKALEQILEHLHASKAVDYLVVMGSTGEAPTLSM